MLEVLAKFVDLGREQLVRGNILWQGDHIEIVLTKKGVSGGLVRYMSANLRKIGCRCVIDELV